MDTQCWVRTNMGVQGRWIVKWLAELLLHLLSLAAALHLYGHVWVPHLQPQALDEVSSGQCAWQVVLVAQDQQWDATQ